ncbi:MAG: primosomal protein N' [Bacteroidales bacterium]|nr:primosomal protein N' [Bacteroidales bacterium]MCM1416297.1 primosomal protein N' [bacterium]MCM1424343.1 primosomal protein N' [bacterium]
MTERYADVIIEIAHEKVDRVFQYRIPEELIEAVKPGVQVRVPFGNGNRETMGYVVDLSGETDYPPEKIKAVSAVEEKGISVESRQIEIAYWLKSNYGSTTIAALKTVLPVKQKTKALEKKKVCRLLSAEETEHAAAVCEKKHQKAKARTLFALAEEEELPYELIRQKLNITAVTLQTLEKQGYLRIEREAVYRNPVKAADRRENRPDLNRDQRRIIEDVVSEYRAGRPGVYLVHGVTGSGKTEVYLGIVEQIVAMGKQAIVLIPEIALTYQTLLRFYKRFGDRVSVMNSTLSAGEKYDQIKRAKAGEIDVIIGPRSALFTPFPNLGVIVMDEEHEGSYKSESSPKYHARETAIEIAAKSRASVVLGSATPSLEAYYRAQQGHYRLYEMKERPGTSILPTVYTIDLREELKQGNRSVFSRKLKELMLDRLSRGEQTILFLNRRGYAGFISCRACGHVMKCPHCDVSLSEHRNGMLVCHYCGYQERKPPKCPSCGSPYLMGFKAGTEQIEEAIYREFPGARVLRMDGDTTRTKESYEKILSAFADEQADILVGTQMIVKGHDFPKVTLVGVLAADLSLNRNDYRAGERTFQLLTQAAGRAGRGDMPGEVVIQTYQPEHYSVVYAAAQDYEGFYREEIAYRELMGYPPVEHMLAVLILSRVQEEGERLGTEMTELVKNETDSGNGLRVIGPAEASIGKLSDVYRHVFYVRHSDYQALVAVKDRLEHFCRERTNANQTVQFDFDPMNPY